MAAYEEAFKKSLGYFDGDELAANVFITKYALTDKQGDIQECSPEDMHVRMASEFARIEAKYPNPMSEDEILDLLKDFKYVVPQGSPMSGIGNPHQIQSLSNCFRMGLPQLLVLALLSWSKIEKGISFQSWKFSSNL